MSNTKKICQNCTHWQETINSYGKCHSNKLAYDYTGGELEKKYDLLIYWGAEGYKSFLITGKNFGCIHFHKGF